MAVDKRSVFRNTVFLPIACIHVWLMNVRLGLTEVAVPLTSAEVRMLSAHGKERPNRDGCGLKIEARGRGELIAWLR